MRHILSAFLFAFLIFTLNLLTGCPDSSKVPSTPVTITQPVTILVTATFTITVTPTATSSPTPTSACAVGTSPTCTPSYTPTSAIIWDNAKVMNGAATLLLRVNLAPDPGATVVLTGSSISSPVTLPYTGNVNIGSLCASYGMAGGFVETPGESYTLTTYTNAGTASSSLICPGPASYSVGTGTGVHSGTVTILNWPHASGTDNTRLYSTANCSSTSYVMPSGAPITFNADELSPVNSYSVNFKTTTSLVPGALSGSTFTVELDNNCYTF